MILLMKEFDTKNAYETLGDLFEIIKDDMCEKNIAQRLWALF